MWLAPCLPMSPKVLSKCQVGKLLVGESEALCVLSDKWHGVKWATVLIASDSWHPLTPHSRTRHRGVRTGGDGGGGRSWLPKSQDPDTCQLPGSTVEMLDTGPRSRVPGSLGRNPRFSGTHGLRAAASLPLSTPYTWSFPRIIHLLPNLSSICVSFF